MLMAACIVSWVGVEVFYCSDYCGSVGGRAVKGLVDCAIAGDWSCAAAMDSIEIMQRGLPASSRRPCPGSSLSPIWRYALDSIRRHLMAWDGGPS